MCVRLAFRGKQYRARPRLGVPRIVSRHRSAGTGESSDILPRLLQIRATHALLKCNFGGQNTQAVHQHRVARNGVGIRGKDDFSQRQRVPGLKTLRVAHHQFRETVPCGQRSKIDAGRFDTAFGVLRSVGFNRLFFNRLFNTAVKKGENRADRIANTGISATIIFNRLFMAIPDASRLARERQSPLPPAG